MPVKMTKHPDGRIEYTFDSPHDAAEMDRLLSNGKKQEVQKPQRQPVKQPAAPGFFPTAKTERATKFKRLLNPNGRKLAEALVRAFPNEVTSDQLAQSAGLMVNQLGPVFRHVFVAGKKAGMNKEEIVTLVNRMEGGKIISVYQTSAVLKEEYESPA
jgi:hypothetical protein